MIPEIGILVAAYVITRMVDAIVHHIAINFRSGWSIVVIVFAVATILLAGLIGVDLFMRSLGNGGATLPDLSRMIAAIYARKSTEQVGVDEKEKSVARQVEHARAFAEARGWAIDESAIFVDDGISGAEFSSRPQFLRLMNTLRPRPPFQALIMSEESRLGREQIEVAYALKQILGAGVRVFLYLENRERTLDSPIEKIMLSLQTFADELERERARQRTRDAFFRKARHGHVTGGRVFGYRNEDVVGPDGKRQYVRRVINEPEAVVVRRAFQLAVDGFGKNRIARILNEEGAPAPQSQRGRPRGWCASSVYLVLQRELYRGLMVWGRRQWVDNVRKLDGTGDAKPRQRPRAEAEIVRVDVPELRIVPEDLWTAARARLDASRELYLRSTAGRLWGRPLNSVEAKYLLSGLASCGSCGGPLEVRSRRHGRTRRQFYMCATHRRKGPAICRGVDAPMELTDDAVLTRFERDILDPSILREALERAVSGAPEQDAVIRREQLQRRRTELARQVENLVEQVASGGGSSKALVDALRTREAEAARIDRQLQLPPEQARVTRSAAAQALDGLLVEWRATLRKHAPQARQMVRKLLRDRLVVTPEARGEQPGFRVCGQVSVEPLLRVVLKRESCAQAVASPTGREGLCTALDLWFPRRAA